MHTVVLITINLCTKFEMSIFIRSRDMTRAQNLEMGHIIIIIIMQRLTRRVSVMRMTSGRRKMRNHTMINDVG